MFVSMWMSKDVVTVTPEVSVVEVARVMAQKRIRRLPVLDQSGQMVGLVSSLEVLHAFPADVNPFALDGGNAGRQTNIKATAADVMLATPVATEPETPIEEAARLMRDQKIGAMPVMRKGLLVGIITESDVFRAFANLFDPDTQGVRITFDNAAGQDVFPLIAAVTHQHRLRVMSFVSLHKHERPLCVVQVTGAERGIEAMLNDIWKSHHQVVSVIHLQQSQAA
jgi:acetoin utilization protein AcuB